MTSRTGFGRIASAIASAAMTTVVLIGALWVQRTREGWPFGPRETSARPASTTGVVAPMEVPASPPDGLIADRVAIEVNASTLQDLGIRLEYVRRERLTQTIQAVATVVPDESRISHVHTRVAGWVEQLDVNTTGETVTEGQPLARIFSQELLSSQNEYLAARKTAASSGITSAVVASGRIRLEVLGMTAEEIAAIEESGEPRRLVTLVAPRGGVVINRGVSVGTAVDPSTPLLTIVDLSTVWILMEVPEANIPSVRVGTTAQVDFPASGRSRFASRVDFVYPTLTERTRTLRVRSTVANLTGTLRPGLYGTATFQSAGPPTITVPRDAIVDTGRQQHVFVASGDRFEPRTVMLGVQLADRVEVREGLREGDRIVSSGVFLLDSESRLRATGAMAGHTHPTEATQPPAPAPPPAPAAPAPAPPSADPHTGHRE